MKYRIENGEVKMPISELNRLNDEREELEKREARVDAIEKRLNENTVATEMIIRKMEHIHAGFYQTFVPSQAFSDIDGVLKKAVDSETKRMQFYLDEKSKMVKELEAVIEEIRERPISGGWFRRRKL